MTPDHSPPVMTRAQRATITGPTTLRRRRWLDLALFVAGVGVAIAAVAVGCG